MKYFCYQGNDKDCGFASLKMLLANLNKEKAFLYLNKSNLHENYTFLDLINIAKENKVELIGYDIKEIKNLKNIKYSFLALINKNHLVMVKKLLSNSVIIYDPAEGILKIDIEKFITIFANKILVVKSFTKTKPINKVIKLIPTKMNILYYICSIISAISLMIGFYFVKKDSNFIIILIFISLFIILELVEKWYLIKIINYFDIHYIPLYFNKTCQLTKDSYEKFMSFKKNYFDSNKSIISSLLIITVLSVLLVINDIKVLFVIILLSIIKIVEKIIRKRKETKIKIDIDLLEKDAINKNVNNPFEKILSANKIANKYAFKVSIQNCFFSFLIACVTILLMFLNNIMSANFILFYFGSFYIIFTAFDNVINHFILSKDYKKEEAKFLDKCNL